MVDIQTSEPRLQGLQSALGIHRLFESADAEPADAEPADTEPVATEGQLYCTILYEEVEHLQILLSWDMDQDGGGPGTSPPQIQRDDCM